jgi:NADH:ubiquinone oxidoreductase subunit 4 (subunit M)
LLDHVVERRRRYVGTQIYTHSGAHGFVYCVVAATITSALVFLILGMVSKQRVATADGERPDGWAGIVIPAQIP